MKRPMTTGKGVVVRLAMHWPLFQAEPAGTVTLRDADEYGSEHKLDCSSRQVYRAIKAGEIRVGNFVTIHPSGDFTVELAPPSIAIKADSERITSS